MSTYFASAEEVGEVIGSFMGHITNEPDLRPKFVAAGTSFLVQYTDPGGGILVDCTVDPPRVEINPPEGTDAEIRLSMSADDGHLFWLGQLNMTVALAKKKVKVSGAMAKMMKLLPALRPAFPRYKTFLEANGYGDKLP
jgi:putative sterol carrier protein